MATDKTGNKHPQHWSEVQLPRAGPDQGRAGPGQGQGACKTAQDSTEGYSVELLDQRAEAVRVRVWDEDGEGK